jgi:O-antigen/teichoic acid export membrane protein
VQQPLFSVVIAAYQAAEFVGNAIESALEQDPPPLEVIVSDDGSTDDLAAAVARFGDAVRLIRIEHGGEAAAKNAGAAAARGEFLSFLDADDRYLPGRFAAIAGVIAREPAVDLVTTDANLVYEGRTVGRAYGDSFLFVFDDQREAILRHNFILGNAAIRRSRFEELGGFDPAVKHTTDWEFCIRLILTGSKVDFIDEPFAEYHLHPAGMSASRVAMSQGRLATLDKTARRSDLSPAERQVLERTRAREELRLAREQMKAALLEGTPAEARRAGLRVLRSRRQSAAARTKALAVAVAPRTLARIHRSATSSSFVTVGDRKLGRQLRSDVAFGIRWGAIDQGVQIAVRIVATIVLARLLTPSDIGIMGLASIVIALGSVVVGLGVSDALIQRRDLDMKYVSVGFTISTASGVAATLVTILLSGPIADLFNEPSLQGVLIAVSSIFFLSGVERPPNDMLVRQMRFRDFYVSSTIATIASAVIGMGAAFANAGVWALVAMAISESFVATVLAWVFALRAKVWLPILGWDGRRARELVNFGGYVAGGRVVAFARGNIDNFAVGRVLGATSLGFYSLAYRLIIMPTVRVTMVLGATAFSVFSTLQDDIPKIRSGLAKANAYVALVCFPATIGIGLAAPLLVPVVFGDKWTPAVRLLEILSLLGPYYSFISLDGSVFQAVGRPRLQFGLLVLDLVVVIPAIVIGVRHGLTGVAVGVVVAPYVTLVARLIIRMRLLHATLANQLRPVLPATVATVCMVAVTLPARLWLEDRLSQSAALLAVVALAAGVYLAAARIAAPDLFSQVMADLGRRSR